MSRPLTRTPVHRYRPWLIGLVAVAAGFAALALIQPGSKRTPKEEPFVQPGDPPGPAPDGMVWVTGGPFWMGSAEDPEGNAPLHQVAVSGFWMDRTEVTNAQFEAFVKATGYKTTAERPPTEQEIGDRELRPDERLPFSVCFRPVAGDVPLYGPWETPGPPWWVRMNGADWRHPEGPGSSIAERMVHPAVHISWEDAAAYCEWAGKRLPTEAEWECAARGGLDRQEFCWGTARQGADGVWRANTFQGKFPGEDTGADGYRGTAPVGSYPANGYGLHDMAGNVWEWCQDWYAAGYYPTGPRNNPRGPTVGSPGRDTDQPCRVRRGGSYLCADGYCRRYLPAARDFNPPADAASHTGFRCVKDR